MENLQSFCPQGNLRGPIMPEQVLQSSLSHGAKLLYAALCNFAGSNDRCWPAHATMAKYIGSSISSVKNYLKELERQQLIRIRPGRSHSSTYFFLRPSWAKAEASKSTSGRSEADYPQAKAGYRNNFKKSLENYPPLPPASSSARPPKTARSRTGGGGFLFVDTGFEKFWSAYPRKEAKELARSVWHRLARYGDLPELDALLDALKKFQALPGWQKEHGRFVPQLVNWLRGKRWLDEPDDPAGFTPKEKQDYEKNQKLREMIEAQEHERRRVQKEAAQALRPFFDDFASRFSDSRKYSGPAWGLWNLLYRKGKAPLADNVPHDPAVGVLEFLRNWQRGIVVDGK